MTRAYRGLLAGYVIWMALVASIYFAFPGMHRAAWGTLGLSSAAGIVAGVLINRPAHPLPWFFLAAANLTFATGDVIYFTLTDMNGGIPPFPSIADGFYLMIYPLYTVGLLFFIRWRTAERDRRSLLDALTVTAALALLSWIYLIAPYARDPHLSWLAKFISVAYPLGDILMLMMLARLLAPGSLRVRSVQLLAFGTAAMLIADSSYGWQVLHGTYHIASVGDLGWVIFYTAWGTASLHPSMVALTQPIPGREDSGSRFRLLVLMLASLAGPVMLLIGSLQGRQRETPVIAVFSAVLYLLVLARLTDMVGSNQRALTRERSLTVAATRLADATTAGEVAQAAAEAVLTLTGPGGQHNVSMALRHGDTLRVISPCRDAAPAVPARELPTAWLSMLNGPGPCLLPPERPHIGARGAPRGSQATLLCPLVLEERVSGQPLMGALVVTGGERELAVLSGTLKTLTDQTALAIERVMLGEEVSRRDQLRAMAREAGMRIREHLIGGEVLHAARSTLKENLRADVVRLFLMVEGHWGAGADGGEQPPQDELDALISQGALDRLQEHFRSQDSLAIPDLERSGAEGHASLLPPDLHGALCRAGVVSLLITPFGTGADLLGVIIAGRFSPNEPWAAAEIDAVESIAADLGRGMAHAQLYEKENRLVNDLQALDAAKSDFFATVSHELRSPLTTIQGYLEILGDDDIDAAQSHTMLDVMRRSTDRLQGLIDDVFTLAKLESGAFGTVTRPVNVAEVVKAAVDSIYPSAVAAKLSLSSSAPAKELVVDGDHGQLERVLINLLTNAVKYTPERGRVEVAATRAGDTAMISVHDTGMGVPDQDQPMLFTRFYRASNASAAGIPGTGLGLAIVRTIVANHGGSVDLTSRLGSGTTVTVRLPLLAPQG